MSTGFFGGYTPRNYSISGTTILDEDRGAPPTRLPYTEEELIAHEHTRTCRTCISAASNQPRCAPCGAVSSDITRLGHLCFGCMHLVCPRHQFWPNRKHSAEDHGPVTGTMRSPRKYLR